MTRIPLIPIVLACLLVPCAAAAGADGRAARLPIAPHALVAAPAELPGFAAAAAQLRSTRSAGTWATRILEDAPASAAGEIAALKRRGFQEGVQEQLTAGQDEALSLAVVLRSAKAARRELQTNEAAELKAEGHSEVRRSAVPAIPGAIGFNIIEAASKGAAGGVLFAVGRCVVVVGDYLEGASPEQALSSSVAGGAAIYHRVARRCRRPAQRPAGHR
ncbi:MAG TPA: hypothetical protein VL979_05150 [Solirubrobacteraceae bacterium]|nr:hypothetical protein [Solirubrobacteraceae bacterium]